jgi:hypothetical protein
LPKTSRIKLAFIPNVPWGYGSSFTLSEMESPQRQREKATADERSVRTNH